MKMEKDRVLHKVVHSDKVVSRDMKTNESECIGKMMFVGYTRL